MVGGPVLGRISRPASCSRHATERRGPGDGGSVLVKATLCVGGLDTTALARYVALTNMNTTHTNTSDKTLANAVRRSREVRRLGVRELSRLSGVAAPQISRLERGEIKKPTLETLISLARAFEWNPIPLLILAGYVELDEARARLNQYFADGAELIDDWLANGERGAKAVEAARAAIADPSVTLERLQDLAFDVWWSGETVETLWEDLYGVLPALGEYETDLRDIVGAWPSISFERRRRVVQFVRDQLQLSQQEEALRYAAEMRGEQEPGSSPGLEEPASGRLERGEA